MSTAAIIVAGGKGLRMGSTTRKQYLDLDGVPILVRTLSVFLSCPTIDRVILAAPLNDFLYIEETLLPLLTQGYRVELVPGGAERQASVRHGLEALGEDFGGVVAVHDGVRPFVTRDEIECAVAAGVKTRAVILAVPAFETLKQVERETICKTLPRDGVWMAQTPQVFDISLLRRAHAAALQAGYLGTDDASLVEHMGEAVSIIPGSRCNIKITTPDDLSLATLFLPKYPFDNIG